VTKITINNPTLRSNVRSAFTSLSGKSVWSMATHSSEREEEIRLINKIVVDLAREPSATELPTPDSWLHEFILDRFLRAMREESDDER